MLEVSERLNSPIPQKSKSTGGSIRYMIHIDSPDKVQYKNLILKFMEISI